MDFRTPLEMFYHWEQTRPDAPWLRQPGAGGEQIHSWATAGEQARHVAGALLAHGLAAGDHVAILAGNSARWVVADLAIMMAGMASVPVYPTMPADKLRFVIEHSDAKAVFVDPALADPAALRELLPPGIVLLSLGDGGPSAADAHWPQLIAATPIMGSPLQPAGALWTICYTSGTTGQPKGVMHSFQGLPRTAAQLIRLTGTTPESRLLSYLPLAHVAERCIVQMQSLYSGASITFSRGRDHFLGELRQVRPDFFFAVPRIWAMLKGDLVREHGLDLWDRLNATPEAFRDKGAAILADLGLDKVTFAFSGGAPISPEDINAWQALGMPLYESYGQSEVLSVTVNWAGNARAGSVGKVFAEGAQIKLSEDGEILVSGPDIMIGYYKDPAKTAETVIDGWIHTGDRGRIDADGFLHITGRLKDIFKTSTGKYIAPLLIESRFSGNALLEQLCLVGRGLARPVLLAVPSADAVAADREQVRAALAEQLAAINAVVERHEQTSHVIVCTDKWTTENGMLTHTLKILRDEVEARYRDVLRKCAEPKDSENTVLWEDEMSHRI